MSLFTCTYLCLCVMCMFKFFIMAIPYAMHFSNVPLVLLLFFAKCGFNNICSFQVAYSLMNHELLAMLNHVIESIFFCKFVFGAIIALCICD